MRVLPLFLVLVVPTVAEAGGGFVLAGSAVSSCGGDVAGGPVRLGLTLGQPLTDTAGSVTSLETTGFWGAFTGAASLVDAPSDLPMRLVLYQNVPNPFRASTALTYAIPLDAGKGSRVVLRFYDIAGRRVRVLDQGLRPPGTHVATWDGTGPEGVRLGAGVYFCQLQVGDQRAVRRLVFIP